MQTNVQCVIASAVPGTVRAWRVPSTHAELADGPWLQEPTKVQWVDATTKLPCLIVRNRLGALCGYAGVSATHRLHGRGYDDVDVDVHGGLTFAEKCAHSKDESQGICHIPEPGTSDDVWWFGFDCAHAGDLVPAMRSYISRYDDEDSYCDLSYVAAEVTRLAEQLAACGQEAA